MTEKQKRRIEKKKRQEAKKKAAREGPFFKRILYNIVHPSGLTFALILAIIALVTAYFQLPANVKIFGEKVRDLDDPYEATFDVRNVGILRAYNVRYFGKIVGAKSGEVPLHTMYMLTGSGSDLEGGESRNSAITFLDDYEPKTLISAILELHVRYRPQFWPVDVERSFQFLLKRRSHSKFEWFYKGPCKLNPEDDKYFESSRKAPRKESVTR